ncbi:sulfur oxidation c-type cytochrome SoxX [Duganella sp. FT92W]|uniref:Sulfur oxidation c-type cytochrome SoxX n=1 Tax=Pseudoduganella rivuli TaxID=2666085 RepID=A0A7X2IUP8_9BURK|nr:sulfur oxidation c-type cytochrome SoxX [Pseudoduganella rivuli]MRV76279.1 sulfur oxidation c-type cytochrome SoxX [Pseudoduganella rivuli]
MAARRDLSNPLPRRGLAAALTTLLLSTATAATDGIPDPLPGTAPGDVERGRAIVANRQLGLCLLCHSGPIPEEPFQGNLAPDLTGAGERSTAAQLRLRIVDPGRINPATIMPAYYKTEGLSHVAPQYRGKTILTAQQVEDVVAYLQTLRTLFAQPPQPTPPAGPSKEKP